MARTVFALLGGVVGVIGLAVVTALYHWIAFRQSLNDGQYSMVFLFTVPAGAVLGAATGYAFATLRTKPSAAGAACVAAAAAVALPAGLF